MGVSFLLRLMFILGGLFMLCFDASMILDELSFSEIYRKMV